jgi:hypothetical protein
VGARVGQRRSARYLPLLRWVWAGDTLEVRTTRIGWPYVDDDGRPQTTDVEIVERFALLNDGRLLRYTQTVTDPASLVEPMTGHDRRGRHSDHARQVRVSDRPLTS